MRQFDRRIAKLEQAVPPRRCGHPWPWYAEHEEEAQAIEGIMGGCERCSSGGMLIAFLWTPSKAETAQQEAREPDKDDEPIDVEFSACDDDPDIEEGEVEPMGDMNWDNVDIVFRREL